MVAASHNERASPILADLFIKPRTRFQFIRCIWDVTHRPWTACLHPATILGMISSGDTLARFGQRVRKLREKAELSQEAFADKCGLDRTYISGIERGKRNVSLRNIDAIARALSLSLGELFRQV